MVAVEPQPDPRSDEGASDREGGGSEDGEHLLPISDGLAPARVAAVGGLEGGVITVVEHSRDRSADERRDAYSHERLPRGSQRHRPRVRGGRRDGRRDDARRDHRNDARRHVRHHDDPDRGPRIDERTRTRERVHGRDVALERRDRVADGRLSVIGQGAEVGRRVAQADKDVKRDALLANATQGERVVVRHRRVARETMRLLEEQTDAQPLGVVGALRKSDERPATILDGPRGVTQVTRGRTNGRVEHLLAGSALRGPGVGRLPKGGRHEGCGAHGRQKTAESTHGALLCGALEGWWGESKELATKNVTTLYSIIYDFCRGRSPRPLL